MRRHKQRIIIMIMIIIITAIKVVHSLQHASRHFHLSRFIAIHSNTSNYETSDRVLARLVYGKVGQRLEGNTASSLLTFLF